MNKELKVENYDKLDGVSLIDKYKLSVEQEKALMDMVMQYVA